MASERIVPRGRRLAAASSLGRLGRSALLIITSLAFAILAIQNPVLGANPLGAVLLTVLYAGAFFVAFLMPFADRLHPIRLVALLFLLTYCIAPQFAFRLTWYFRGNPADLVTQAAAMSLLALASIVAGALLAGMATRRRPEVIRWRRPDQGLGLAAGVALFAVGSAAYILLFAFAGGMDRMVGGEESRVQFFKGFGALYHASFFLFSGGALLFARTTIKAGKVRLWSALPLVFALVGFILLQGRLRAFTALMILVVTYHYVVRPIPRAWILWGGLASLLGFLFVGYARDPEVRFLILSRPWDVVVSFVEAGRKFATANFGEPFNRLIQAMLVLDNVGDRLPYRWGATFLQVLDPFMRMLGRPFQVPPGVLMFRLAQPGMGNIETGFHPSLVGEVLMNVPWMLAPLLLGGYGAVVQWTYQRLVLRRADYLSLATYGVLILPLVSMVVVGVGQLLFEMLVLGLPLAVARFIVPRPKRVASTNE